MMKHGSNMKTFSALALTTDITRRLHRRSLRLPTRKKWAQLDICVPRRLWLRQGQMQEFLGLKVGGGCLNLQIWDLNRAHETERTVFPILQVFRV